MLYGLYAVALIVAAFLIALAVLLAFGMVNQRGVSRLRRFSADEREATVFLFENEVLLDATQSAHRLLESGAHDGSAWSRLAGILAPRFPDLDARMRDLADLGEVTLRAADGTSRLKAEWHDGVARVSLKTVEPEDNSPKLDRHSTLALTQELETLRTTTDNTPYPTWRETEDGTITWCNAAYLELADSVGGSVELPSWPPARVFRSLGEKETNEPVGGPPKPKRVPVSIPGQNSRYWFDVTTIRLGDDDRFCAAVPADALVRAESSLQEFVTTLTKTFASLPIGLAIFDRSRRLAVFNPALMDLTVLPADFLISKPSFSAFLDRLREARIVPEPKDYRSWRQQLSDLEAAAQNGTYEETWMLPTGQTYRVTGRPHPEGAVALLFEDISSEMSATRRYRAELETGQAVLDALPQGVAVFTSSGVLSMANAAYAALSGNDPSTSLSDLTVSDAIKRWSTLSAPTPVWDQLRMFVAQSGNRDGWAAQVSLVNGQSLTCDVTPLAQGATMVSFLVVQPEAMQPVSTKAADELPLPMVEAKA